MRAFRYERPDTLAEAIAILQAGPGAARPLAGGTDLIIRLRDGSLRPDTVVDVKRIRGLEDSIHESDGKLTIGARAVMTDIAADPRVAGHFRALAEAALVVGAAQIRNRATLAGNICNASPAADTAPALLVYGAEVVVAGPDGERRIPIDEFFVRSGVTTLAPGELVTAIELPIPPASHGSTHTRRTRRRGHDLASVTLASLVTPGGETRIAYGSVGPRPYLAMDRTGTLADPAASDADRLAVLDQLFEQASPSSRSLRAGPDYRLAMLRVLGLRAIETARARFAAGPA